MAVEENDFETNYARYGSYYVGVLENIEEMYPGAKQLLTENGFSVQAQDRYLLRTAVDQRGEQTINRDAETVGGVKYFSNDSKPILKWTLNRSEEAKTVNELAKMANMKSCDEDRKSLRPSQILKTESMVTRIINVLKEEYINPFGTELDKTELYHLSSGVPLPDSISYKILKITDEGEFACTTFIEKRLVKNLYHFMILFQDINYIFLVQMRKVK